MGGTAFSNPDKGSNTKNVSDKGKTFSKSKTPGVQRKFLENLYGDDTISNAINTKNALDKGSNTGKQFSNPDKGSGPVKDWFNGKAPILEKTPEERDELNKNLTEAQTGRLAENERLQTTAKAVKDKISPAQAAIETGENLEETQKKITGPKDFTEKADKAIIEYKEFNEKQKSEVERDILQTSDGKVPKTPEEAKKTLLDYAVEKKLVTIDEDGNIDFARLKMTPKSVLSRIGSVLSALLTVASGGAIPPINFYELTNSKQEDEARVKLYTDLMDNIAKEKGQISADTERAKQDTEEAARAGYNRFMSSQEGARMQKDLENTLVKMATSTNQQKDLSDFMAKVSAKQVPYMYQAMLDSGLTEKQIRETVRANAGSLPGWTEYVNMGTNAVGAIGGLIH